MYSHISEPSASSIFFPFNLCPFSHSLKKFELWSTEESFILPGHPVTMSRNLISGSTIACKIMLWWFSLSSHTLFAESAEGKHIMMCVVSIAPQQFGRPRIFSNLDVISVISGSVEGHWRWWSALSSIISTKRQVTWDTVEWFRPNASPIVKRESPELSLLNATATWSFKHMGLPFVKMKFPGLAIISSLTRAHM